MGTFATFFLAGYDTTATALSFLCYILACNPDKQELLYQEIIDVMGEQIHLFQVFTSSILYT